MSSAKVPRKFASVPPITLSHVALRQAAAFLAVLVGVQLPWADTLIGLDNPIVIIAAALVIFALLLPHLASSVSGVTWLQKPAISRALIIPLLAISAWYLGGRIFGYATTSFGPLLTLFGAAVLLGPKLRNVIGWLFGGLVTATIISFAISGQIGALYGIAGALALSGVYGLGVQAEGRQKSASGKGVVGPNQHRTTLPASALPSPSPTSPPWPAPLVPLGTNVSNISNMPSVRLGNRTANPAGNRLAHRAQAAPPQPTAAPQPKAVSQQKAVSQPNAAPAPQPHKFEPVPVENSAPRQHENPQVVPLTRPKWTPQQALDPRTNHDLLERIAAEAPHLRPLVAANPGADATLLDWLAALNDPDVDVALDRRALRLSA
ncbi:MAG: hypothetical protein LBB58_01625 [Cellulomonadaceae bacterium]|nr:hypothetical protein [Cellulomonadaceae bacterium]